MPNRNPRAPDFEGHLRKPVTLPEQQLPAIQSHASPERYGGLENFSAGLDSRLRSLPLPHNVGSVSPNEPLSTSSEFYRGSSSDQMAHHSGQFGLAILSNPKRVYRQRRKDPSCDACRERKVKCDATETTSCTECSSRNVRCQFTKDTNRRMSSIKQVQDLERQLQDVKQQLERVRASEHAIDQHAYQHITSLDVLPELPDVSRSPRRMLKARPPHDLSSTRTYLLDVGRGLMKPPITPSTPGDPDRRTPPLTSLPARDIAQSCLDVYYECIHRRFQILFWPQFCRNLWELYNKDLSSSAIRETIALSFAVLALGALYSRNPEIKQLNEPFVLVAYSHIDMWVDKIGIDQALVAFLISVYMTEINRRSASLIWLGSAIRIAQDRGLHIQGGHWSPVEGEMRKRIWYSLYVCDRVMAAELGRPMLINDEDCDTEYPDILEEEDSISPDDLHPQKPSALLASIHVARLLSPLAKLCRSLCVTIEATRKFEAHLADCISCFPPQLQLSATGPLDPLTIFPLLHFQNARLFLYRHNMSPACSSEQRSLAIENCTKTAQDTARIISRCYLTNGDTESLEGRLRAGATSLTCTHLWRSMLFLTFGHLWREFYALLHYSALIGDEKPINVSCGRHLSLFFQILIDRHTTRDTATVEEDEELIVFLSGDVQGGTNSWVWNNTESGTLLSRRQKHSRARHDAVGEGSSASQDNMSWDTVLSEEEMQQWGGWGKVRDAAQYLEQLQRYKYNQAGSHSSEIVPATVNPGQGRTLRRTETGDSTKSRMTIASIT